MLRILRCRPTAANDSLQLSQLLLKEKSAGATAQYGALVFDDPIIRHIPDALRELNASAANLGTGQLLNMLPQLKSFLPARLPTSGSGQLGSGQLLPQLSTPESRIVSRLVRRFQDNPGLVLCPAGALMAALLRPIADDCLTSIAQMYRMDVCVPSLFVSMFYIHHNLRMRKGDQGQVMGGAGVMLLHNSSSYHALPALLSGLHGSLGALEVARSGNASSVAPVFIVKSHPLPLSSEESVKLDSLLTVRPQKST